MNKNDVSTLVGLPYTKVGLTITISNYIQYKNVSAIISNR